MLKLRLREIQGLVWSHRTVRVSGWDLNPGAFRHCAMFLNKEMYHVWRLLNIKEPVTTLTKSEMSPSCHSKTIMEFALIKKKFAFVEKIHLFLRKRNQQEKKKEKKSAFPFLPSSFIFSTVSFPSLFVLFSVSSWCRGGLTLPSEDGSDDDGWVKLMVGYLIPSRVCSGLQVLEWYKIDI